MNEAPQLGEAAQQFMERLDVQGRATPEDSAVVTKLIGAAGPVDAGIVSVVVDLIAGHFILRRAWPCGISTTNLTLTGLDQLRGPGLVVASARLVSMTTNRGCVEIDLSVEGSSGGAVATATFNLFRFDELDVAAPGPWRIGEASRSLDRPLWQEVGVDVDPTQGVARLALRPEIANHVNGLQGGVTAALLEAAALSRCRAGSAIGSMVLTYLSQGRVGPFEATTRSMGPDADVVVATVADLGNDDRPVAHAVFSTVDAA